jgi:hypothetical protein
MSPAKKTASKNSPKKTPKKAAARVMRPDFTTVFSALRAVLAPYEGLLARKTPSPGYYYLESRTPTYKNRPMFFAAVRAGKSYVSYHLMPVAGSSEMLKAMSPELKNRMQGKACFNFTAVDELLFKELADLTRAGYDNFKSLKYL